MLWYHCIPRPAYTSRMTRPYCGLVAVANICAFYGVETNMSEVYQYAGVGDEGTTLLGCKQALQALGIRSEALRFKSVASLPEGIPILCVLRKESGAHAAVIVRRADQAILIDGQEVRRISLDRLDKITEHMALVPRQQSEKTL